MTHQQALDLLPWYAAETLSDEERQAVAEHLDICPECAMELTQFQELRLADLELSKEIPPAPANMLQQALAQIDDYEQGRAWAAQAVPAARSWWDAFWNPEPGFARLVMAAQFALVLALAVGLLLRNSEPDTASRRPWRWRGDLRPPLDRRPPLKFAPAADIEGVIGYPSAIGHTRCRRPEDPAQSTPHPKAPIANRYHPVCRQGA
jgi:anti-sigma factor RsiW